MPWLAWKDTARRARRRGATSPSRNWNASNFKPKVSQLAAWDLRRRLFRSRHRKNESRWSVWLNASAAKQHDAEADVSALERQIDQFVYGLYGLTPEEVNIVERAAE